MSDIRLVNVVPIVNGWNDAAKKNLEEAKTLMASGNHLDYNKGVVKESVANLVSGFADDLMSAPFIDPETLRPMAHKNIRKEEQLEAARMRTISALVGALKQVADLAGFEIVGRVVLMDKDSGRIFR